MGEVDENLSAAKTESQGGEEASSGLKLVSAKPPTAKS
jgi:hypothetical protein